MDAQHMEHAHGAGCQHDHHHSGGCCGHEHCHEDGCGCGHGHGGSVEKGEIIRLAVAGALFVAALLAPLEGAWRLASFLVPYLAAGWDVLLTALKSQDMYLAGACVIMLTAITIVGTFISDILLVVVDPRIRLQ